MLKIDVIKFEAQDVITTSIPNLPEEKLTCYCNDDCYFHEAGSGTGWYVHASHDKCSDCRKTGDYRVD